MRHRLSIGTFIAVGALLGLPCRVAGAQSVACDYAHCSLNIVPRLAGLSVVRGEPEERVTTLPFLWPARVAHAFGSDSVAMRHAARATRRRALAALFTDVGGVLVIAGATRFNGSGRSAIGTGAGLVAASVPIQFAADAELSRAIWSYNRQFAR